MSILNEKRHIVYGMGNKDVVLHFKGTAKWDLSIA